MSTPVESKKIAQKHITMRIPLDVYAFYRKASPCYTQLMRDVLVSYAEEQKK